MLTRNKREFLVNLRQDSVTRRLNTLCIRPPRALSCQKFPQKYAYFHLCQHPLKRPRHQSGQAEKQRKDSGD